MTTNGTPEQCRHTGPSPNGESPKLSWRGEMSAENGFEIKTVDDAWFAAQMIHRSGYAGKSNDTPAKCFAAIMLGKRLGVDPFTAVNRIAVINGLPSVWGDLAIGLVQRSGLLDDFEESEVGEGEALTAVCRLKRKGIPTEYVGRWSVRDNKTAGLEGRNVHKNFPKRMRQMRARGFALRDAFADILGGLYLAEELIGLSPAAMHSMSVEAAIEKVDLDAKNGTKAKMGFPAKAAEPQAATPEPPAPEPVQPAEPYFDDTPQDEGAPT